MAPRAHWLSLVDFPPVGVRVVSRIVKSLLFVGVAVASILAVENVALAVPGAPGVTRAEIRSMPIEQRPMRPGHFYGNFVRRRAGR